MISLLIFFFQILTPFSFARRRIDLFRITLTFPAGFQFANVLSIDAISMKNFILKISYYLSTSLTSIVFFICRDTKRPFQAPNSPELASIVSNDIGERSSAHLLHPTSSSCCPVVTILYCGRPFVTILDGCCTAIWLRWDCCCVCTRLRTPRPAFRSSRSSNRLRAGDWLEVYVRWRGRRSRRCADAFLIPMLSAYHPPLPPAPSFLHLRRLFYATSWIDRSATYFTSTEFLRPFLWPVLTRTCVPVNLNVRE